MHLIHNIIYCAHYTHMYMSQVRPVPRRVPTATKYSTLDMWTDHGGSYLSYRYIDAL